MIKSLFQKQFAAVAVAALLVVSPTANALMGTVNANDVNFRENASTDAEIMEKLEKNTPVTIEAFDGEWVMVSIEDQNGYIHSDYVSVESNATTLITVNVADAALANLSIEYKSVDDNKTYQIDANSLNLRGGPGTGFAKVAELKRATVCTKLGVAGEWVKIRTKNGDEGFVMEKYVIAAAVAQVSRGGSTVSSKPVPVYNEDVASAITAYAKQFLGVRYVYGASSPKGFDCSGYTQYVYKQYGISLPRSSASYANVGVKVSRSELQPGDLLLFDRWNNMRLGHIGIYLGNDQFIHASTSKGKVSLQSLSGYNGNYLGARRVIP